jgi:homoserine dehydrogenase
MPDSTPSIPQLNIGLFGLGTAGTGLVEVLPQSGLQNVAVKRICVKNPTKPRPVNREKITFEPSEILDDPHINVVVETINGVDEAFHIVQTALRRGKHVVTANKKMVAHRFSELLDLQAETGKTLLYESAACGAIPIVRTLEEHFGAEPLDGLSGIFNGTSNYILTRMLRENLDFDTALAQAQANGFAELDPSSDIDGDDAKYKLILLTAHSYGHIAHPEAVFNLGIRHIRSEDLNYAREQQKTIKLLPICRPLPEHRLALYVLPAFVEQQDVLYGVQEEFNGVKVQARYSGQQFFKGRGAGGHPTGSALLADLAALQQGYRYPYRKHRLNGLSRLDESLLLDVYCSFPTHADVARFPLRQAEKVWQNSRAFALKGQITLQDLQSAQVWIRENEVMVVSEAK